VKRALAELEDVGQQLVSPLWDEMQALLPPGLASRGHLDVSIRPEDFVPWLVERVRLRLVTGEHDANSVAPVEVGSGLQSLLELAAQQAAATRGGGSRILAIEEPEAFLHPSAQRTLARAISRDLPGKRIVSTHSPLLVEEASYGDVVLVRDHRFFEPARLSVDDPRRASINTALLNGYGAEMAFANGVLLVEGEGDRLYFEALRRRLALVMPDGAVDQLYVVPAGSKTAFAPWLRLLRSYGRDGDRPVRWLIAPDGDAATEVIRAWDDARAGLAADVHGALQKLAGIDRSTLEAFRHAARQVNQVTERRRVGLHLLPVDLEAAVTMALDDATAATLARAIGSHATSSDDLRVWLGRDGNKGPWMRAVLGRDTPAGQLSEDVKVLLRRWLALVVSEKEARDALRRL
jgi:hypothetical protein